MLFQLAGYLKRFLNKNQTIKLQLKDWKANELVDLYILLFLELDQMKEWSLREIQTVFMPFMNLATISGLLCRQIMTEINLNQSMIKDVFQLKRKLLSMEILTLQSKRFSISCFLGLHWTLQPSWHRLWFQDKTITIPHAGMDIILHPRA
jgi:hypothetical protein